MKVSLIFIISNSIFLFCACSGLEKSERDKIKKLNAKKEVIYRKHDDVLYVIDQPKKRKKNDYFWEGKIADNIPLITKEYFRCKGSFTNQPITINPKQANEKYLYDCRGFDEHSLPVRDEKEYVYPALIEILNYVQEKALKKVVITCAHRCPNHNLYAEPSAVKSKHLIGAEVDFYVLGSENNPEEIISLIKKYYEEKELSFGQLEKKGISEILTFENKEICLKVLKKDQGRDFDNQHPYPYLSIELKYDRTTKKPVIYNWHSSHQTVMKW